MNYESSFNGKSAIVTGAEKGIGRAIAKKLHELGVIVFAVSLNPANLASLKSECPSVNTVAVDLGDWKAAKEAIEKLPVVHYLVNNAAILRINPFMEVSEQEFDETCNVNLKGIINVSQIVAKKMIAAGKPGAIINISSVGGLKAQPQVCTYSILKAGLDHLTKIMAIELGPHSIRVNSLNPGTVMTDMLRQLQEGVELNGAEEDMATFIARIPAVQKNTGIDEVVGVTLFLLSDVAPMITGSSIAIDGGYCIT
jgi:NAD(P)-dependent dehydrogenase (short-subunit alcohol dehydrogenase family)